MTINKEKGINSNSQLGFLRTIAVKNFIEKNTDLFDLTRNKFILYEFLYKKHGAVVGCNLES